VPEFDPGQGESLAQMRLERRKSPNQTANHAIAVALDQQRKTRSDGVTEERLCSRRERIQHGTDLER
jgi:hypothetical protein